MSDSNGLGGLAVGITLYWAAVAALYRVLQYFADRGITSELSAVMPWMFAFGVGSVALFIVAVFMTGRD